MRNVLTTKHSARMKPGPSRDGKAECSKYMRGLWGREKEGRSKISRAITANEELHLTSSKISIYMYGYIEI